VDKSFTEKMELKKELTVVTNLDEIKTETAKSTEKQLVTNLLEPLTLEVEAIEGTWVSISVDGKEIKDYRLKADEIQQWEAKENYLLTLGNSKVVRVLLNGREIETNRTNHLLRDWLVNANLMP
jgi:formiminotetrahydrofolate cyclodeaminase